jgi:hypothetical protein
VRDVAQADAQASQSRPPQNDATRRSTAQ